MISEDTNEDRREIIKVKASTYTNYPTKRPNELIVDTEIGKHIDRSAEEPAQFRPRDEGTEIKELRLEAQALEALKEKEKKKKKGQIKDQKKRRSIRSRRNNCTNPITD
jgi:hypothetical protein